MTKQEGAQKEWAQESDKRHGYVNPALAYSEAISEFKSALKAEIEKEIDQYDEQEDKFFIRGLLKAMELIDKTKPLK